MRAGPGTGPTRRITAPVAMPPPRPPARHAVRPSRRVCRPKPSFARKAGPFRPGSGCCQRPGPFAPCCPLSARRLRSRLSPLTLAFATWPLARLACAPSLCAPGLCARSWGDCESRAFRDEVLGLGLYVLGHASWAVRLGSWVLGLVSLDLGPWALGLGPNKKPPVFTGGQIMCVSTGSGLVRPSEQPEHDSTHKGESQ